MDIDALGEGAAVGTAQLGGDDAGRFLAAMMLAGSLLAAMADASAWRSRCGWAASPTLAARRAKARLA
jgi:hypothetical protein